MHPRSHAPRLGRSGPARAKEPADGPVKSFLVIAMLLWLVAIPAAVLLFASVYPWYAKRRAARARRRLEGRTRMSTRRVAPGESVQPAEGTRPVSSARPRLPPRDAWRRAHVRGDR
jgi:hypothetical protein